MCDGGPFLSQINVYISPIWTQERANKHFVYSYSEGGEMLWCIDRRQNHFASS